MSTVALVGPDGAGKTTVARRLIETGDPPLRYLYMGINTEASNVALPTKRLRERVRSERGRRRRIPAPVWGAGRLVNRVADEWLRQAVSWYHQLRGYTVLYDRHFWVDFSDDVAGPPATWDRRVHRWLLEHAYPKPDLVVVLDAPAALLFSRKGESDLEELERRRRALERLSQRRNDVVVVDATRPVQEVCDAVRGAIRAHVNGRGRGRA